MERVPVGKVLLRNVIRHTGAHNKLQEETEMWKIREWEKQTEETYWKRQSRMLSDTSSSRMRSDGFDEEGHRADWKARNPQFLELVEDDLLRARSLSVCNRWFCFLTGGGTVAIKSCTLKNLIQTGKAGRAGDGSRGFLPQQDDQYLSGYSFEVTCCQWVFSLSGFEFTPSCCLCSDQKEGDEQNAVNGKKKSPLGKQSARESHRRKKTKKSHKKKQKKRSHKKRKKKKKEQGKTSTDSSRESECSGEETPSARKGKHKRKKKTRKVPAKEPTSSSGQDSDFSHASSSCTSSSEDSESEGRKEKGPPRRKRKKRPSCVLERQSEVPEKRSKRKNWKVAGDEKSEDSSDED